MYLRSENITACHSPEVNTIPKPKELYRRGDQRTADRFSCMQQCSFRSRKHEPHSC